MKKKKIYWLSLLFFIIDLGVKQVIINTIKLHESIKVIPKFFYLTYTQNTGAAFSILQDKYILILIITIIALFFINKYINKEELDNKEAFCYGLIIGGILGNLFDRLRYQYVIDFFDFRFGSFHYPVFNTADTFIVVGIIILMIISFIKDKKKKVKG